MFEKPLTRYTAASVHPHKCAKRTSAHDDIPPEHMLTTGLLRSIPASAKTTRQIVVG